MKPTPGGAFGSGRIRRLSHFDLTDLQGHIKVTEGHQRSLFQLNVENKIKGTMKKNREREWERKKSCRAPLKWMIG